MYLLGFEYQVSPNMLCLETWCGALPARLPSYKFGTLQVFSKLGGNFLGCVAKPCAPSLQEAGKAYITLRDMQAQAALVLGHAYLPPRYLAIYVESHRVTSPSFPFKDCLDQEQLGLLGALHGAERIDVVYDGDTDFDVAKASLETKGLVAFLEGETLRVLEHPRNSTQRAVLAPCELDLMGFNFHVKHLIFHNSAATIGELWAFPGLKSLKMRFPCTVRIVDFLSLSRTCKLLTELTIIFDGLSSSLVGISELSNLERLSVTADSGRSTLSIPCEVGSLSKLTRLDLCGQQFVGMIPSELGQLRHLNALEFSQTNLVCAIPSELGNLSELRELRLTNNKYLHGELPQGLNNLSSLKVMDLRGTPNVARKDRMSTKNVLNDA